MMIDEAVGMRVARRKEHLANTRLLQRLMAEQDKLTPEEWTSRLIWKEAERRRLVKVASMEVHFSDDPSLKKFNPQEWIKPASYVSGGGALGCEW